MCTASGGAFGEAVLDQNLLDDRPVDDDGRGQPGLHRGAERVEAHEPVAAVVQPGQLVPLAVADLQARDAVGGHGACRV